MSAVIVIGGGAAGIVAAWRAASLGARTVLLEKTDRLGTKILISGGGKCNITHDGPLETVIKAFRPNEARFIRPACYKFPNTEIVKMLTARGLRVYTRPDGRIFPVDQTAREVVAILESYLREAGVEIRRLCPVASLERTGDGVAVRLASGETLSGAVVLATGGSSYPKTGSTGDGFVWARTLGHTVVPVRAALAPMDVRFLAPGFPPGVALRHVTLRARQGKVFAAWRGDLLFTHHGVSGPCALGVSREVEERLPAGPVSLEVDLVPDVTAEEALAHVRTWARDNPRKQLVSFPLPGVAESLAGPLWAALGLEGSRRANEAPQKALNRLADALKSWPLGTVTQVPLEKGEVVAGGVSLDEVDPQTMASTLVPGLFLCGEVLDIAGPVGGYNLQAAFATGFVAGETAARTVRDS